MATECRAGRRPLFILFNYDMCVSDVSQAVRAAWVNIRGVHRARGTPNLCLNLCSPFVFAPFSVLLGFIFSKKFWLLLFEKRCPGRT